MRKKVLEWYCCTWYLNTSCIKRSGVDDDNDGDDGNTIVVCFAPDTTVEKRLFLVMIGSTPFPLRPVPVGDGHESVIGRCRLIQYFFGRGEKPSLRKAFEAYSWSAERGCAEAMYMSAWMYGVGSYVETDPERRQLWLQRAVDKGYAPAMNDLAVILLGEADRLDESHPQMNADSTLRGPDRNEDDPVRLLGEKRDGENWREGSGREGMKDRRVEAERKEEDEREELRGGQGRGDASGTSEEASLSPEQAQVFENVMEKRKRAMKLLQEAAKTGHTDAMTNLGNMQEAMGYFEDARNWYR